MQLYHTSAGMRAKASQFPPDYDERLISVFTGCIFIPFFVAEIAAFTDDRQF